MTSQRAVPRIAFLGPPPLTNGYTVTKRFAAHFCQSVDGVDQSSLHAFDSHPDIINAVVTGAVQFGVIAVENTLDSLIIESIRELERLFEHDLACRPYVCWEELLPIRHLFITQKGDLRFVKKIYSHPSALRQCSHFLRAVKSVLPHIEVVQVKSTGDAVQQALASEAVAALASQDALDATEGQLCEVDLLAASSTCGLNWQDTSWITDFRNGLTRFWVLGSTPMPRVERKFTTTVRDSAGQIIGTVDHPWQKACFLLNLPNRRGTLFEALRIFAKHDTSLAVIYPYPRLTRPFEYLFFVEVEGHCDDANIQAAVSELNKGYEKKPERERPCILLGCYPNTTLLQAFPDQRAEFRQMFYPESMTWRD